MPPIVAFGVASMLFVGMAPLPYGYYTLLRLVACGTFAFATYLALEKNWKTLPWIYGIAAVVFNPIIKIHLPKEVWMLVDAVAALLLIATYKKLGPR